ncbi:MAG TPA: pyridoxal phosphate-dependent aminotransferase [Candidatus Blautia merdavium]|uniref:cysteine-S-conjugate beta-lyase n=1 Tax=Candidatus Blautia merdavium TaxID=2838494 RepID=A0A9D2TAM1_9FIRM|nr:pyridoxal phosphate-dependent aminotransferase [Candidatus Blautia merdavium]
MKTYDFDTWIDRTETTSIKHAFKEEFQVPSDAIPLWVADMDFRSPDEVCDAVKAAGEFGVFGYSKGHEDYYQAVIRWMEKRHGWTPKKEWLLCTPGVVCAISIAIQAYTSRDDAVMIMQPVYHPFKNAVVKNQRRLVEHPLLTGEDGRFQIDFERMEEQLRTEQVRLFILCTPHNPGGRVWTKEELEKIIELCLRYDVLVVADEIHHDFTFPGHPHTEFAPLSPEMEQRCVICTAPSKTFNIAGLGLSNIFIPNEELRQKFQNVLDCCGLDTVNLVSLEACKAAYTYGADWLEQLLVYINQNASEVRAFLKANLPQVTMMPMDGTYLAWLDFSGLGLSQPELNNFLLNKAKLWMNDGEIFGTGGTGHMRLNLGCPRGVLMQAMKQLKDAADQAQLLSE